MTVSGMWTKIRDEIVYHSTYLALTFLGPAQLDDEHDPREALKRKYGKDEQSKSLRAMRSLAPHR